MTTQDNATYDTADLAPISTASTPEQLQEAMDVARIAANAQRDLEAAGENPLDPAEDEPETPEEDEQPDESAEGKPAEEAQEPEDAGEADQEEPEGEAEAPPEAPPTQQTQEQQYSRRDAARFKSELDTTQRDLQRIKAQLQSHQASDSAIIGQIVEQAGSEQEFQQLTQKNNLGQANDQERQRLAVMQQWRTVAGPIYRQAQLQVTTAWGNAFAAAGQLSGMTDQARQTINQATDPQQALEAIHAAGVSAGVEQTRSEMSAEHKKVTAENQRLKAELSSLKTKQTSKAAQPTVADGSSPASMPKLPPMFLEDGVTLNPDFEKLASSGKLYGVEKLTG